VTDAAAAYAAAAADAYADANAVNAVNAVSLGRTHRDGVRGLYRLWEQSAYTVWVLRPIE
jgi:hypothetical protein